MNPDLLLRTLAFAGYFIILAYIGWRAYQRTADIEDFILGGRRIGSWVAALSAGASDMSGWLMMGLPGLAYASGFESIWLALGLLVGTWLNWRLLARRLRVFSQAYGNALTLPEFLANRFQDHGGWLRILAALFILIFFLLYTSAGLVAGGKLFEAVFGLPYVWAVAAGTLAILLYTSLGGFLAVAWTDVFQGLLMAAALIVVPLVALDQLGGPTAALTQLQALNPALLEPFTAGNGQPLGFIAILSLAAWGLGYFGQPHILARFQAIRSPEAVPQARRIAVGWSLLTMAGAILTGLVGVLLLDSPLLGDEREKVFIQLVNLLFHPLVAGILLAAILAAIMSTADSQLLVTSATFTEDFYRRLLAREATPGHQVIAGRLAVVAVACLAFLLALDPRAHVLDLVAHAWAGFGATFGPVLLVAVYWSGMTWRGALAGMLTGGLVVIAWPPLLGDLFALYEIVPGFLLSLIAIWLVSRFGGGPRGELAVEFNRIARQLSPTDVVIPSR